MGKGKRHIPMRTCVVCRKRHPKAGLDRIVLDSKGYPVLDVLKRAPGRGAYVCRDGGCRERLQERGVLKKALRSLSPRRPVAAVGA
jgi:hypothetical protein